MKKEIKEFTIERKRWLNGKYLKENPHTDSALYDSGSKRMCCLGVFARACGLKVSDIKDKAFPCEVGSSNSLFNEKLLGNYGEDKKEVNQLVTINDSMDITAKTREKLIKAGFKSLGIKVNFI